MEKIGPGCVCVIRNRRKLLGNSVVSYLQREKRGYLHIVREAGCCFLTVYGVVHADEVKPVGGLLVVRVPAVQQHGHVVVPVEEDERLLSEDHEHGVP